MQFLKKSWKDPSFILDTIQTIVALGVAIVLALDMTGIWTGTPWLTDNLPSITLIAVCLLIVSAFLERRLQIDSLSERLNQKLDKLLSTTPGDVKLSNREALNIPFETRIANAKDVCILGMTLVGILSHYENYIEQRANDGCKFRIAICDPNYTYSTGENPKPWRGKSRTQHDTDHSVVILKRLQKNKNVQAAFFPVPPHFSLLLIDASQPYGEIQVELLPYDIPESRRPHFILKKASNQEWYEFFMQQFDSAWQRSRPA